MSLVWSETSETSSDADNSISLRIGTASCELSQLCFWSSSSQLASILSSSLLILFPQQMHLMKLSRMFFVKMTNIMALANPWLESPMPCKHESLLRQYDQGLMRGLHLVHYLTSWITIWGAIVYIKSMNISATDQLITWIQEILHMQHEFLIIFYPMWIHIQSG